jgi:hypothetical protein
MADKELTIKQQRFVDVYDGDIKNAAVKAGLAYPYCRRLMTFGYIKSAIRNREDTKRNNKIATRQERQEFWTKIMRGKVSKSLSNGDKMRASELLGKSEMDFVEKTVVEGEVKHTIVIFDRGKNASG